MRSRFVRTAMPLGLLVAWVALPAATTAEAAVVDMVTTMEGIEVIRLEPRWDAPAIGTIRAGQSVRVAQPAAVNGAATAACKGRWVAIEPRGYVCTGRRSLLGRQDDIRARAAAEALPDRSNPALFRVGTSIGAPRYLRIPTPEEQQRTEKNLDRRLERRPPGGLAGRADLVEVPAPAALARYFSQSDRALTAREDAIAGTKVAWAREFDAAGRTWLVTPDLELIPKDKVRVESVPTLRGVDLRRSKRVQLPVAFLWLGAAAKVRTAPDGRLTVTDETWPRHTFVPLTGITRRYKGRFYLQTEGGDYIAKEYATTIKAAAERPFGVGPQDKWVDVRVTHGYLVAYEGDTPVFATAISAGADSVFSTGRRVTKLGRYTVQTKALSFDMSGVENGKRWHIEEVPWVAVYKGDYALHGAWWHDAFGRPRSHGCINLSPADARFLFEWLDPVLPDGWYSVSAYGQAVKGTVVQVRP